MKLTFPECDFSPGAERLTEKHVQAIWYDCEMRPERMAAHSGEEVVVVHPGEWNLEAGPDFLGAVLEVGPERRRVCGDVEIHLRPGDWTSHRHGEDPAYGNVVAHVTWFDGAPPPSLPASAISISIGGVVAAQTGFSPECIDLAAYPFARISGKPPPCRDLVGSSPERAAVVLRRAGERRLAAKARRLAAFLAERPGERLQVFYEELMSALGYRRNSLGFRYIARMVPLGVIAAEPANVEHALLSAAGFVDWDRRASRPNNTPERRLSAAAHFFASSAVNVLASMHSFSKADIRIALALLRSGSFMGAGRAAAAIANVVIPFALAEKRIDLVPEWLAPEDLSSPMRLTAMRMFGRDHNPRAFYLRNGLYMQGLLQIHREFCLELYPECAFCPVAVLGAA